MGGCINDANKRATGISYADGLIGYAQQVQLSNVHFVDQRLWFISGFAQDDFKITPKLTLNLGLRYELATPALEGKNQMANFDPTANAGAGGLAQLRRRATLRSILMSAVTIPIVVIQERLAYLGVARGREPVECVVTVIPASAYAISSN